MTYPSKVPKAPPFSEVDANYTPRMRAVFCQYCKYTIETNLYGAKCGQCKSFLIEYCKSHFPNGLADRDNRAT